jgi:hypothetical protein
MSQNPWVNVGKALKQKDFKQAVAAVTTPEARGFFKEKAMNHSAKLLAVTASAMIGTFAAGQEFRKTVDEIIYRPAVSPEPTAPAAAPEPSRPPSYKELQAQCKEHGISAKGSAALLQERLAALTPG